jgi:hypothetical protein
MQTITFTRNTTRAAGCAKVLARSGAQSPGPLLSGENIDKALWAAYRRYDKTAVMGELLRRCLHQPNQNGQPMRGATHG